MATNFPVSLDALTNPTVNDNLSSPSHAGQHANANDAIEALQAKVGIDSSGVATSIDYKLNNIVATKTGAETLTNKTLTNPIINGAIMDRAEESWNIDTVAATGTINFDILTSSIWYYRTAATADWTVNFRGNSTTTLASLLDFNDSITCVFAVTQGATPYKSTAVQIDGSSVTPKWQGGSAPLTGNASSVDIYSYTIVRLTTVTYDVFASVTQFK